jgi:hypothetical protein
MKDMHFGRCPVTEQEGYRDFVCVYLKSVCILDGVEICQVDEAQAAHRRNQLVRVELQSCLNKLHEVSAGL